MARGKVDTSLNDVMSAASIPHRPHAFKIVQSLEEKGIVATEIVLETDPRGTGKRYRMLRVWLIRTPCSCCRGTGFEPFDGDPRGKAWEGVVVDVPR